MSYEFEMVFNDSIGNVLSLCGVNLIIMIRRAITRLEHDWIMTHNHGEKVSCPS